MFLFFTLVVPTISYLGAAGVLAWKRNYPDAIMFFGYAFANAGVTWRLLS